MKSRSPTARKDALAAPARLPRLALRSLGLVFDHATRPANTLLRGDLALVSSASIGVLDSCY